MFAEAVCSSESARFSRVFCAAVPGLADVAPLVRCGPIRRYVVPFRTTLSRPSPTSREELQSRAS